MSLELIMRSGEVSIPQEIENLEQLKSELAPKLEYYSSLVVTEDSIKEAKADRARLNKLKTAVEERRKDIKKQVMGLYEPLEKQCRELTALIDAPICAIDGQLKNFDEIRKKEKLSEITKFFEQINCLDFVRLEDVLAPKWGNAAVKTDRLKADMAERVQRISDDHAEIKKLYENSPLMTAVMQKFRETKDKAHTLAYAAMLEKQYRAEQEERKAQTAEVTAAEFLPKNLKITEPVRQAADPILSGIFKVTCTRSQLIALRDHMKDNGIKFEVVK